MVSLSMRATRAAGNRASTASSTRSEPSPRNRSPGAVQLGQAVGVRCSSQHEWHTTR